MSFALFVMLFIGPRIESIIIGAAMFILGFLIGRLDRERMKEGATWWD